MTFLIMNLATHIKFHESQFKKLRSLPLFHKVGEYYITGLVNCSKKVGVASKAMGKAQFWFAYCFISFEGG